MKTTEQVEKIAVRIAEIAGKLESCREEAARVICAETGKDFDNASHYAEAVIEVARRYGRFTDEEQALMGRLEAAVLRRSNHAGEFSLHSTETAYNPDQESMDHDAVISLYGLWRSIERGVKRLRDDPIEAINDRRREIEREVKELKSGTLDILKNTAKIFISEAAIIYMANRMKEIDADYVKCKSGKEISSSGTCNRIAGNEFSELCRKAAHMPGISGKAKFMLLQMAEWPKRMKYPHIRENLHRFLKNESAAMIKYFYFLGEKI